MSLPENLLTAAQADIQRLIDDGVRESPHVDFKRELPPAWNEAAKHEFLADVTAFANSGGGDLIFGVDEDGQAQASAIVPQPMANTDQEIRRLQDFLLHLTEPRVPGVIIHVVQVAVANVSGHVLIVRVPQSWAGPHRVKTNQHFYVRDGLRKRQLDVPELRSLILRTDNQARQVSNFRTERLGRILSGEAPNALVDGPVLVAHIIPTQAALGLVHVDPIRYFGVRGLPFIGATGGGLARVNLDGALAIRNENIQGQTHGYSLLFRNGYFEATRVFTRRADGRTILPSFDYEAHLIALLSEYRRELDFLGINGECAFLLSLLRANEMKLGVDANWIDERQTLFDRKHLILPDVIARTDTPPEQALKPVFDLVWQAAGFARSQNYNAAGAWVGR